MSHEYELDIIGDSGWNMRGNRVFKMYFSEPEQQLKTPPGILLLIAGYGGEANSKVYRKMRRHFADEYNLYVIQCNYLGWEFMQEFVLDEQKFQLAEKIYEDDMRVDIIAQIDETPLNYNEMGPFQALDNVIAVKSLIDIIEANEMKYDNTRICCYGHSQGAYLAHMCNSFFPNLFTDIIDNSAWLSPVYLNKDSHRFLVCINEMKLLIYEHFLYRIMDKADDKEIYDLSVLYPQFENFAKIVGFHGSEDTLVSYEKKKQLTDTVNNFELEYIMTKDVDGVIFKSATHGLDADFLNLFKYAVEKCGILDGKGKNGGLFTGNNLFTQKYKYTSSLIDGIPCLEREKR